MSKKRRGGKWCVQPLTFTIVLLLYEVAELRCAKDNIKSGLKTMPMFSACTVHVGGHNYLAFSSLGNYTCCGCSLL